MPARNDEAVRVARALIAQELAPDDLIGYRWDDGTQCDEAESRNILALAAYEAYQQRRYNRGAQRKAMKLLRRILPPHLRAMLSTHGYIILQGSAGGWYRVEPRLGWVRAVERHGKNFYDVRHFCFHPREVLPPADDSICHILSIVADEPGFIAEAETGSATRGVRSDQLWNGEYVRRMRATRKRLEAMLRAWCIEAGYPMETGGQSRLTGRTERSMIRTD